MMHTHQRTSAWQPMPRAYYGRMTHKHSDYIGILASFESILKFFVYAVEKFDLLVVANWMSTREGAGFTITDHLSMANQLILWLVVLVGVCIRHRKISQPRIILVSRGQTLISCRGVIAFSISAPAYTESDNVRETRVWSRETR